MSYYGHQGAGWDGSANHPSNVSFEEDRSIPGSVQGTPGRGYPPTGPPMTPQGPPTTPRHRRVNSLGTESPFATPRMSNAPDLTTKEGWCGLISMGWGLLAIEYEKDDEKLSDTLMDVYAFPGHLTKLDPMKKDSKKLLVVSKEVEFIFAKQEKDLKQQLADLEQQLAALAEFKTLGVVCGLHGAFLRFVAKPIANQEAFPEEYLVNKIYLDSFLRTRVGDKRDQIRPEDVRPEFIGSIFHLTEVKINKLCDVKVNAILGFLLDTGIAGIEDGAFQQYLAKQVEKGLLDSDSKDIIHCDPEDPLDLRIKLVKLYVAPKAFKNTRPDGPGLTFKYPNGWINYVDLIVTEETAEENEADKLLVDYIKDVRRDQSNANVTSPEVVLDWFKTNPHIRWLNDINEKLKTHNTSVEHLSGNLKGKVEEMYNRKVALLDGMVKEFLKKKSEGTLDEYLNTQSGGTI